MSAREVHIEHLVGRRVLAANGRIVGRLEELVAEPQGEHYVVTEYHIGTAALRERLSARVAGLFSGPRLTGYRAKWNQVDLTNPEKPRLTCSVEDLRPLK
jgi:sporulation protein YlmC with PRC-barrel domain